MKELKFEARKAKDYRDELDEAMQNAEKFRKLEVEVLRYQKKLQDYEGYKSSYEASQQDNA